MENLFRIESFQDFVRILNEIINNLSYASSRIPNANEKEQDLIKSAEEDVRKLIYSSNFDMKEVQQKLSDKNWDKERIKYFKSLLDSEKTKLLYGYIKYHNSRFGETILQSDWLLKLVIGTSELNTKRYTLLQLILSTVDSDGVQTNKMFELSKDVVLKMIKSLEQITAESLST